jgi:AraC-like DNA-binding protein
VKRSENKPSPQLSTAQARQLVDHIHANLDGDLRLFELAKLVRFSPRQFVRIFANTFGTSPHQFIMKERVDRAKPLLSHGLLLVEIASALGFASQSHFSGAFRRATGMSPGRFRRVCIGRGSSVAGEIVKDTERKDSSYSTDHGVDKPRTLILRGTAQGVGRLRSNWLQPPDAREF